MARVHYAQSWEDPLLLWEIWQRTCPDHVHMVASGGALLYYATAGIPWG